MAFNVGDTVVYPHHGAALIESVGDAQDQGRGPGSTSFFALRKGT